MSRHDQLGIGRRSSERSLPILGLAVVALSACKSAQHQVSGAKASGDAGGFNQTYAFADFPGSDFVIDGGGACITADGSSLTLKMPSPNCQPRVRTKLYFVSGKVSATLATPNYDTGVVSAFYLSSREGGVRDQTEIDVEFRGRLPQEFASNYWLDGRSLDSAHPAVPGGLATAHNYAMEWDSARVTWSVDGNVVHTFNLNSGDHPKAQQLYLSLWDGKDTNGWAGAVPFQAGRDSAYSFVISDLKVEHAVVGSDPN